MNSSHLKKIVARNQRGVSLIEVLVTLAILAGGLLGTAGLMLYSMKLNKSSEFRTQAVYAASDLFERIEANKEAANAGSYAVALGNTVGTVGTNCAAAKCSAAALANFDLSAWETTVAATLPLATWSVTRTAVGPPSDYTIVINWTDRSSIKTNSGENFAYTASKTIGN